MKEKHIKLIDLGINGVGTLDVFIQDINKPLILVCPGGGYDHLSTREALPVVNKFLSFGYNAALLKYSVAPNYHYPTPLDEINASIEYLLKSFKNVFLMGFSAGGHLAGLGGTDKYMDKISGMILSYPVISLGKYTHMGSRINLLGDINNEENQNKYSINNRVNENTKPTFIWCTQDDNTVPYENSLLMKEALDKYNIKSELVIFPHGPHGMALADETATTGGHENCKNEEVAIWPTLANKFIKEVLDGKKN